MMRVTKLTDYAVALLSEFSLDMGKHTAGELSAATKLQLPIVSKILKMLARGKILSSKRGVGGGYKLARNPQDVTLEEIIVVLEGPIDITKCLHGPRSLCRRLDFCVPREGWKKVNESIRKTLAGITLEELINPSGKR